MLHSNMVCLYDKLDPPTLVIWEKVSIKINIVSAFTKNGQGGNLAGVVVTNKSLHESQMQRIAAEVNLSETAFVTQEAKNQQHIRFFTPTSEVALCGHATIASYSLLAIEKQIEPGFFKMKTKAGIQKVHYAKDGLVRMSQNLPIFGSNLSPEPIARCLGLKAIDIGNEYKIPPIVASTGLRKIFVPIKSLNQLQAIQPQIQAITDFSLANEAIGMYCYSLETLGAADAHCRNFAPVVGIMEDSATGTSAAALSCVLHKFNVLPRVLNHRLQFEQGYCIDQPAELIVFLEEASSAITSVEVAGRATLINTVNLPEQ